MPSDATAVPRNRPRLLAEGLAFYVVAPTVLAVALPPEALFPALSALTAVGLGLLHFTPDFHWSDLTRGMRRIGWGRVAAFTAMTAAVAYVVVAATAPDALFALVRADPRLMAMIVVLYPALSALPQEIVFRPLFFRRYRALLPEAQGAQIALNAAAFSFAHLMYWSWIVAAMAFAGGLVFAWSYRVRANFAEAVALHAAAGIVVFTMGLGVFFYSGNVTRPF